MTQQQTYPRAGEPETTEAVTLTPEQAQEVARVAADMLLDALHRWALVGDGNARPGRGARAMASQRHDRFDDYIKCPRCEVKAIPVEPDDASVCLSCTTRDDGAPIHICTECGEREIHMELRGRLAPIETWPLSIDALLEEDRVRYEFMRETSAAALRRAA